ncbi:hypothetical protein QI179_10865 [Staphylococcus saprophyticus]|nr:hypothetical protein [Staphylococcus saprophyticus]
MKIEKTIQLDLIELINYIQENDIRDMVYNGDTGEEIEVTDKGKIISLQGFNDDSTFTLKIFKDITEDTLISHLVERRDFHDELVYEYYENVRITDIKEESSTSFYIENEDLTLKLIWRFGRLVE